MSDNEVPGSYDGEQMTFSMTNSDLRKGGHIVLKGRPCKIVDMSTSRTGRHGHTKVHFVGIDIFTGRKIEDIFPSTHVSDVPIIHREEYKFDGTDVDDKYLLLTDMNGNAKNDVPIPEGELGRVIMDYANSGNSGIVTVVSALGEESCFRFSSPILPQLSILPSSSPPSYHLRKFNLRFTQLSFTSSYSSTALSHTEDTRTRHYEYNWIDGAESLEKYKPGGYHPIMIGDMLHGRYHIVDKLGFGGYSTVWLARDTRLEQYVAVKVCIAGSKLPIWEMIGMRAIFSSEVAAVDEVISQQTDVLGSLPLEWFESWGKRDLYFDDDGVPKDGRYVWSSIDEVFEEGVQRYRRKFGMGEIDGEETAAILDLMRRMLTFRPEERPTAREVLQSRWMVDWVLPDFERSSQMG
ncbi:Eukaryotic elongation factor 5A hypusine DNA-binding OB fold [Aspergillus parasiticus SU-1]|uniref:Eukaryotic elongation factor 5A hypusine DNA-binding OB fold n=1 Tax=Aspergillus parasiticus (strain ATCC 56775 / NRRL 5862 / SRRC 143 / SU-1) TaxID=1403190 RepID=A0A0F0IM77_ASPPU|nr:Eukaryotic elongation factor 5A hypusine DNA-binding OB fold [Aspergillus parasiticus SU-1]